MKILQRLSLFAVLLLLLAVCIYRAPLRFGADADALFQETANEYTVGDDTVVISETTLSQGSNALLLRGWTRNGDDRCVIGSFQSAGRTLRSRAVWSVDIPDHNLSVRRFDGGEWQEEPIRPGKYRENTAFFLIGDSYSVMCYVPQVWTLLENGSRQLAENWLGWMQVRQTRDGWRLTLCAPGMDSGSAADFLCVVVNDRDGIDWSQDGVPRLWSTYRNAGEGRWCFDGYYMPSPGNYVPTGDRVYFCNPASYLIRSFVYQAGSSRIARNLGIAMLDTYIRAQNSDGFWPTQPGCTWLADDYGIGPGFYDTRFNTDFAALLVYAQDRYPSDVYRDALRRYCDFFADYAKECHVETKQGGWYVPDYWHEDMTHTPHTSLNHQLAEILLLYGAADTLADSSLSDLADRMLAAIDESGEDWLLEDGNLHYQVSADGEYGNTDYPYLTYDDLFKLQKYLNDHFSYTDPVLDLLMTRKRAWMDENGITAYMK